MGMDVYGNAPTHPDGEYFRASVWAWRPTHILCETVAKREFPDWAYNDGAGLDTQPECDELATQLENYLKSFPNEEISIESDMRVDDSGRFLQKGQAGGRSVYSASKEHLQEFIKFLRACGGFQIC